MRLVYKTVVYRINFKHGTLTRNIAGVGPIVQEFTTVTIRIGEYVKGETEDANIVASATVRRFFKDKASNETARKEAIKAVLRSMKAPEAFRTAVWLTYHQRPGGILAAFTKTSPRNKMIYDAATGEVRETTGTASA